MKIDSVAAGMRSVTVLCCCGTALVALSLLARQAQFADDFDRFVPITYAQGLVYALGAWMLLQAWPQDFDERILLGVILVVAVMLRLIALATPPNFLSTDVYRYVWDGRLQAAGVNPYLHIPADPVLEQFRDEGIYSHINRIDTAPTIYAPFAQIMFFAITRLGESVTAMRLGMLGFEAVTVLALAALLKRLRLPMRRLALYLWHPLPVWEFASGAHVDAMMLAMALVALVAAMSGRRGLAWALLAAATLTKFLPLVMAPALYRRWDWRMPAAFLAVAVLLYALYASAGWRVLGFLPGYASEEGLTQGEGLFVVALLREIGLSPLAAMLFYAAIALAVLAALTIRSLSLNRDVETMPTLAASLATATLVLISPHYAWYFCWLVPFICFVPRVSLMYLTCSVFYLYASDSSSVWTGLVIYGPFLALLAIEQLRLPSPRLQEGSIS